ncbi:hypothetical protein BV22DRAFT_580991 [Leucogyrophana mollusca]|uniref:Uncharacterized protein n=1 Tax=Leucogyrophana mollusca TaxID=85980 RepID=A0ACB8BFD4_9AGAM|nr:hypothetical protein BV22DRAFT_580991 [Leucogyrophana mollusca]
MAGGRPGFRIPVVGISFSDEAFESACNYPSWTEWTANCPATLYQQWPDGIPFNTEISPWAYLPLVNSQWDLTHAQDNATGQGLTTSSSSSTNAATSTAQSTSISRHSTQSTSLPPSSGNGPSTPSSSSPASETTSDRTT